MKELEKNTGTEMEMQETTGKTKKEKKRKRRRTAQGSGRRKKRIPLFIAAALAAVFIGYSMVSSAIAKNAPVPVNTVTAERGDVEETVSTSGRVSSEQSRTYYAPVNAVIALE